MKVLMISGGRGGVYRFTYEIVSRLSKKGYNFFIAFITGNENLMDPPLKNAQFTFINNPKHWWNILKFPRIKKFDIIHSNFAAPIPFLSAAKKPIIFTCHGMPLPWLTTGFKEKFLYTIEKLAFHMVGKKAIKIVSVSKTLQKQLAATYNIHSQVIYHGIEPEIYQSAKADKVECKRLLGTNPEEKIILFVGTIHPFKDPLTLIKSFSIIAKEQNKIRLILVGEGKLRPKILELAKNFKLLDKISIHRRLKFDELVLFYRAADVFVLPSINEGLGIVTLEAMASGTPCIVSNSGASPEIVQDCGLIFKQGDYRDLAEKILQVLEDENLAQTLALKGYERVKKVFSWEKSIAKYETLYSSLANQEIR
ncbi:MAG: glycosyltransferase family 4 protein [Candidatus Bathyarchaeia archaeon]